MENPYSPPSSNLDIQALENIPEALASLRSRFLAALIDGIIMLVIVVPAMYFLGIYGYAEKGEEAPFVTLILASAAGFLAYALVNGHLLAKYGQTVGKRFLKIKIVSVDGTSAKLSKILLLRVLPIQLMGLIPVIGNWVAFGDALFVFREDRRCVHDLIAGTKVVNAAPA